MTIERSVYVISDLHIGGTYPAPTASIDQRKRGFRMMTHAKELAQFIELVADLPPTPAVELVINGDFVDFLAEEKGAGKQIDLEQPPEWTPFRYREGEALAAFRSIVERDASIFTALRKLVMNGKTLTILLGNHDLELSLPDVRAELENLVGPGTLHFIDDGQALDLGEVLIDHGNLFDPANVVDHDRLRMLRAAYSRGWFEDLDKAFAPPAGSKLVATVMNPIKTNYGFIDLLKPESEALFALLLAIEPSYRSMLDDLAASLAGAAKSLVPRRGVPWILRNVADEGSEGAEARLWNVGATATTKTSSIESLVAQVVRDESAVAALRELGRAEQMQTQVAGGFRAKLSLLRLLIDDSDTLESRIPQVQATLRALADDTSFDRHVENKRYLDAASWLAQAGPSQKGYKAVVFGHTHHAKALPIPGDAGGSGGMYFNTGTWANLMRFPAVLTDPQSSAEVVRAAFTTFATNVQQNELEQYLEFTPTYVRLDLGSGGELIKAELRDYDWGRRAL